MRNCAQTHDIWGTFKVSRERPLDRFQPHDITHFNVDSADPEGEAGGRGTSRAELHEDDHGADGLQPAGTVYTGTGGAGRHLRHHPAAAEPARRPAQSPQHASSGGCIGAMLDAQTHLYTQVYTGRQWYTRCTQPSLVSPGYASKGLGPYIYIYIYTRATDPGKRSVKDAS